MIDEHVHNIADSVPCTQHNCAAVRAGRCGNTLLTAEDLIVKRAEWICRTGRCERGLFCNCAHVSKGTFVASFGAGSTRQQDAKQAGYQIAVRCRVPGQHSAVTVMVAPHPNWEECQHMGPMINHSCCVKHCEYVSSDIDEDIDDDDQ